MPGSILGTVVRRVEDPDLLTGRGTFIGNLKVDGMLHVVFVRSNVAHAKLLGVDMSAAQAMEGVVAVYAAGDLGLTDFPQWFTVNDQCVRPVFATDRVRFVGDIIAAVVAPPRP